MNLLLDTHTVLWSTEEPARLSPTARSLILEPTNRRLISAATIWELAIKIGLGKLRLSRPFVEWTEQAIADLQAELLPISLRNADVFIGLPFHHRDPFDRLLIAQAQCEHALVVGVDEIFDRYGVKRVW